MPCIGNEFLCKYPPWYLLLFSNLYIYVFYQIWETFGCHKSSFIALLPFIPHFFLWKSNYTCLASFNIMPPVPQSLFPPSPSVFFFPTLFFRLHNFCIFKFSDSSVISNLAFRVTQKQSNVVFPIYWIFLLKVLYFLVLEFSFGYFIVSISLLRFPICALFQTSFNIGIIAIVKGNGIPLQYSCLGNPKDRGA